MVASVLSRKFKTSKYATEAENKRFQSDEELHYYIKFLEKNLQILINTSNTSK